MVDLKDNPVGIDKPIQSIQKRLYEQLNFENFEGYGRIYKIERDGKTLPMRFNRTDDYIEVLRDDRNNGNFFFVENDTTQGNASRMQTEIDIIFQLNLKELLPDVAHRADEEIRELIFKVLNRLKQFELSEIIKGQNALDGFDTTLKDMQPYHFIKFTGTLKYQLNC